MEPWETDGHFTSVLMPYASTFEEEVYLAHFKRGQILTLRFDGFRMNLLVLKPAMKINKKEVRPAEVLMGGFRNFQISLGFGITDSPDHGRMVIKGGCQLDHDDRQHSWNSADPLKLVIGDDMAITAMVGGRRIPIFLEELVSVHVHSPSWLSMDRYAGKRAKKRLIKTIQEGDEKGFYVRRDLP